MRLTGPQNESIFNHRSSVFSLSIYGQAFKEAWAPLVKASCIDCHDADTDTPLNPEKLGHDLSDTATFRQWVMIIEQVDSGEMPPKMKKRPDRVNKNKALATPHQHPRDTSDARGGRHPAYCEEFTFGSKSRNRGLAEYIGEEGGYLIRPPVDDRWAHPSAEIQGQKMNGAKNKSRFSLPACVSTMRV